MRGCYSSLAPVTTTLAFRSRRPSPLVSASDTAGDGGSGESSVSVLCVSGVSGSSSSGTELSGARGIGRDEAMESTVVIGRAVREDRLPACCRVSRVPRRSSQLVLRGGVGGQHAIRAAGPNRTHKNGCEKFFLMPHAWW